MENGHTNGLSPMHSSDEEDAASEQSANWKAKCLGEDFQAQTALLYLESRTEEDIENDVCVYKYAKEGNEALLEMLGVGKVTQAHPFPMKALTTCKCGADFELGAIDGLVDQTSELIRAGRCPCLQQTEAQDVRHEEVYLCGFSLIHVLTAYGHINLLKWIIEDGVDVNTRTRGTRKSPLHIAARQNQVECAKVLISAKANIDAYDGGSVTPLYYACRSLTRSQEDTSLFDLLLDNGCCVHTSITMDNITMSPLLLLVYHKIHYGIDRLLGKNRFQVEDVWRADSQSPLSVAIIYNDLPTVRKLVSAVNVKELCLQKSPLCMAISYGLKDVALLLTELACDPNATDKDSGNHLPLLSASFKHGFLEVVKALVTRGAYINQASGEEGELPLHASIWRGHMDTAEFLLEAGADPHLLIEKHQMSALHYATMEGTTLEFVQRLLDMGVPQDAKTSCLNTPLSLASAGWHYSIVHLLLNHGCDPQVMDKDKNTPLQYFAYDGNVDMMKCFLDLGCDSHVCDTTGSSAIWYAVAQNQVPAVKLLLEHNVCLQVEGKGFDFRHISEANEIRYIFNNPKSVFQVAMSLKLKNLVKVILMVGVEVDPSVLTNLNEEEDEMVPIEVVDLQNWVQSYVNSPPTLQRLCRRSIREMPVRVPFLQFADLVDIPKHLKDFLLCRDL